MIFYDVEHLYTIGTKREMRKNSIDFFHIPFFTNSAFWISQRNL